MVATEGQDKCLAVPPPTSLSLFTAATSALLAVVTVPCNVLVCLVILRSPPQFKNLRTPFTYFILNLAITDVLVGITTEPMSVVYHLMEAREVSSPSFVRLFHLLYFLPCTVSVLSIMALTLERFFAIAKPLRYRRSVNHFRVIKASGMIWILSPGFLSPYFAVGYRTYSFLFANVVILVTLGILLYAYFKIIKTIQSRKKLRQETMRGFCFANQKATLFEEKVTFTFTWILILFAICYATPCLLIYIMNLCTNCSCEAIHWLRDTSFLCVICNSAINPFLYAWRLPSFRKGLRFMMLGISRKSSLAKNSKLDNALQCVPLRSPR
ncbi:melanocyte-stimulating hormone receptor-like [Stylophora pistillata]|uniref:melanocyte-stimulating hormone receptor-like n=1 Tax=Stylophora pistillata TaxID=50429 RepID=UPI000C0569D5|nr:melanocyte-stimulating hormone receptor-like [Stylophora pistillata]